MSLKYKVNFYGMKVMLFKIIMKKSDVIILFKNLVFFYYKFDFLKFFVLFLI